MAPIAKQAIKLTQRLNRGPVRTLSLNLIEEATKKPDLAHFTRAELRSPSHTSKSDPRPHVTASLATEAQAAAGKVQVVHIYHDSNNYIGHQLYEEQDAK
ncbi:hypothetical protein KCU81_g7809, partial [Aureobasidium melanogenum]|uniref:Uncharacterized protein n=1 Tax=Aureobasidium melanogenum (strain CBS 110374) TaxID=1043003 RepID=A0A074VL97_AURM1